MDRQVHHPLLEDNMMMMMMMQRVFVHTTAAAAVEWDLLGWIGNSRKHLVADAVWTTAGDAALALLHHSLH